MPKHIDLYHKNTQSDDPGYHGLHVSSLAIYPDSLQVIGAIPHCETITPKTIKDADRLIEWLQTWKKEEEWKRDSKD